LFNDYTSQVTVEFLAAKYLADVRKVQPHGPYHLAGASFGGLVAYEMACEFRAQGEEVALVALFDTGNPAFCRSLPRLKALRFRTLHALERARYRLSRLTAIATGREIELARKLVESARNRIGDWLWKAGFTAYRWSRRPLPEVLWDNLKLCIRATELYRPKPYPGRIILFKAEEQKGFYGPDSELGWGDVALGGVQIIDVPGDHMSLLEKPRVFQLANHLRAAMEASQLDAAKKREVEPGNVDLAAEVTATRIETILPLGQES
jgi:thioesterase domain-containing protein